jgi:Fe-S-cluster containining protein
MSMKGQSRRLRIAITGQSPCETCWARCCKQKGHDYAVLLLESEYARFGPFAADVVIADRGIRVVEKVLPYCDGRCQFLDDDDRCLIYEDRPHYCRRFQCVRAFHHGGVDVSSHGEFLKRNRDVLEMLERL